MLGVADAVALRARDSRAAMRIAVRCLWGIIGGTLIGCDDGKARIGLVEQAEQLAELDAVPLDPQAAALGQLADVGDLQQELVERLAFDDEGGIGVLAMDAGAVAQDAVADRDRVLL